MIDNPFRKRLENHVEPLMDFYETWKLHPNTISVIGLLFALLAACLIARELFLLGIIAWWIGRLFDGTDGIWARRTNRATAFGGYLDIVCDMFAYSSVAIGFAVARPDLWFPFMVILLGYVLCITSALALGDAGSDQDDNRGLRLASGIAEGGETGIAYTAMCLFPAALSEIAAIWIFVLAITVGARTALAYRVLSDKPRPEDIP